MSGRETIEITDENLSDALHIIIEKMKMIYQTVKNNKMFEAAVQQ